MCKADLQAKEGRALVPWISDTFELDPESGIANVVLGPASCASVFIMYLWHQRCRSAAGVSCEATRKKLSCSGSVVVITSVTCLCMHGTLGFKIFSTHHGSLAHLSCAALFCFLSWLMTAMVTTIEYRGGIAPFALTVARGVFSGLMLGCIVMVAIAIALWDCGVSQLTNFSSTGGLDAPSPDNGTSSMTTAGCLEGIVLTDTCLQMVLESPPICVLAPAFEIGAIFCLLVWYLMLAQSFATSRVLVEVRDSRFRSLDHKHEEEEGEEEGHESYLRQRQSAGSDQSFLAPLGVRAREGDNMKSPGKLAPSEGGREGGRDEPCRV